MKNTIKSIMIGSGLIAAASSANALEFDLSANAGYHSIYEFRGVNFRDDLFTVGADVSTELACGLSLSAGVWYADTDGFDSVPGSDFDELDLYFGLAKSFGNFEFSTGYTAYLFPGSSDARTDEIYFGVATEIAYGIGLSLTHYQDVNEFDAGYLELEAGKSYELNACTTLDLAVGLAYSFDYNADVDGGNLDGFNHFYVGATLNWEFYEGATLSPYVKFIGAGSDHLNDLEDGESDDLFVAGVNVTYAF